MIKAGDIQESYILARLTVHIKVYENGIITTS